MSDQDKSGQLKSKLKAGEKRAAGLAATGGQEASDLASDIAGKAKKTASETTARLQDAVEEQKAAGAKRARGIAGAISRAADQLDDEIPHAAHYVRRAAEELEHLSDEVRDRDASELVEIVQNFVRRQPTVVLGATALAGFAAMRFFMTSARPRQSSWESFDTEQDQTRQGSAAIGRPTRPEGVAYEASRTGATSATSTAGASMAPGPSASSGNRGGFPQGSGNKPKPSGSSSKES